MFIKNFLDYFESIKSGLIKTHRGDLSVSYIVDTLKRLKFNINGDFNNDIIKIEFNEFYHIDSSKLDDLFDTISAVLTNKFGWFPSSMNIILTNGMSRLKKYDESEIKLKKSIIQKLIIEFDSRFDSFEKFSGELYHLSIEEYKNKVLKNGLYPKSKSKKTSHIDRIYVCKDIDSCKILIPQMKLHYSEEKDVNYYELGNKKYRKNIKSIIYKLKVNNVNLYKDPRYLDGYYILDNIDPNNICIVFSEK